MNDKVFKASERTPRFFIFACLITWTLAAPTAIAWLQQTPPSAYAMACAGLSAFGPLLAVLLVGKTRREMAAAFGPWRTQVGWIALALCGPIALRFLIVALYAALGGEPARWFYAPTRDEQWAALVLFPLAEEFGWRGYAYPRLAARYGLVRGSLILGVMWGVWHLAYSITPAGNFDGFAFIYGMIELPLYSLLLTWVFERAQRSMAVAIVFHATAHINHIELAPRSELGLHALHLLLLLAAATLAARSLSKGRSSWASPEANLSS